MSQHILCNEPEITRCAPLFRLQSSNWINADNFGQRPVDVDPPAGIRLRWTCPFVALPPADRLGRPVKFIVERAGPLQHEGFFSIAPRVGHRSRAPTPRELWLRLDRVDSKTFRVPGPDCEGASAVTFSVPVDGNPATVTLIDVDGVPQVVADVVPGDDFHFQWSGLKMVTFSSDAFVQDVIGLDLDRANAHLRLNFSTIAVIDAAVWPALALADVAERVANAADVPFLSLSAAEWDELRVIGREVDRAIFDGADTPDTAAALAVAAAMSFETAALMGWGFIDGEHASAPTLDDIEGPLLDTPDGLYAYRVRAQLQTQGDESVEAESSWTFAQASLAPALGDVTCAVVPIPVSRAELTNMIRPGPQPDQPDVVEDPRVCIACEGQWDLVSDALTVEAVLSRPIAQNSAVTGERFVAAGTFLSGLNRPPRRLRGNSLLERREHRFDVPFFDCDVDCEVEASDFWDRRSPAGSAGMVQPLIEYEGTAPPLRNAACHPPEQARAAEVELTLDSSTNWTADPLATFARAKIAMFMRDPTRMPAHADVEAGPPSPTANGHWSANMRTSLAQNELDRFVGGQLAVGALTAQVLSMGPVKGKIARCTFDAVTSCAGADLYSCPTDSIHARLAEDPQSARLWIRLPDTIDLQPNGAPARQSITTALPALEASTTLYFASRLEFGFEGQMYASPLTVPVPAPYLHPVPAAPKACVAPQQLATDYYGRVLVRAEASHCHPYDPGFAMRLAVAPGAITTVDAFLADRSAGIFAAQTPVNGRVLFDAFNRLATLGEDEPYTAGAFNVRTADDVESAPALSMARLRRLE